jgi:hypothetical protein
MTTAQQSSHPLPQAGAAPSATAEVSKKVRLIKKLLLLAAINAFVLFMFVALLEGALGLLYNYPPNIPQIVQAVQRYNLDHSRPILQYLPECFEYSPELSYRIRPESSCTFATREYTVQIHSNRMGLRDDNTSLDEPEIIILGDSQAMGWGVEQHETIEAILEKSTGKKVLNGAIPSYGTAREMRLLSMLDRSNLKTVIIAHNDNDYNENKFYRDRGNRLQIMRSQDYRVVQMKHRKDLANVPTGKYLRRFWPLLAKEFVKKEKSPSKKALKKKNRRDAGLFLNVIGSSGIDFSGVNVLVLEMNDHNLNDGLFLEAVKTLLSRNTPDNLKNASIHLLDLSTDLRGDTYFRFGDHINVRGTAIVAERIEEKLLSIENSSEVQS